MRWQPFRNLGLMVAAFALACLLWFIVSGQEVERSVSVPLMYRNIPAGLQITGLPIQEVNVHIRGGYSQISQLGRNDVSVIADLADSRAGMSELALTPNSVSAPLGVEATQVEPGTVTVTLENAGARLLPVHPKVSGQPAAGFMTGAVIADPPTVFLVGPLSHIEALKAVTTEPVSVEGATKDVTQVVGIDITDPEVRLREVRVVRVTVKIRKPGH
jgi:YbbR domain-containing protein